VGNCPQQPAEDRAAPHSDSEINSRKKVSKRREYEGKFLDVLWSAFSRQSLRPADSNRSVEEFSLLFILAAGRFSNMFTTYSHTLCGRPRQLA
jgi:hypothetical protein